MKKTVLVMVLICAALHAGVAQTQLPYFTGFDDSVQKANWKTYRIGSTKATSWELLKYAPFSPQNSLVHIYPVNGDEMTEDWHVSPPFTFSNGGIIDSLRYYFSGFGIPQSDDTVAIYLLTGSDDPTKASSKTLLYDFRGSKYNRDTWNLVRNINIPAQSGSVYLAFRYHTVVNWLNVMFDNLALRSKTAAGVYQAHITPFTFFPNPVENEITFNNLPGDLAFKMEIYDINCHKLGEYSIKNNQSIYLDLPSGPKFYQIIDTNGMNCGLGKLFVK